MTYERTNVQRKKNTKSNQNSQGASIPLENRKVSILCGSRLLVEVYYILLCMREACAMFYAHRDAYVTSPNQRGSKFSSDFGILVESQ